ncbi:MAG: ABC transporter substrate-binding protein [Chloroflexaceae bacterium]|jgi:NitT/TauT family transport system substrate-binding protein|nr:ABC transporter substrate-binding protein [Chloroflexaceae bacterium]
MYRKLLLLLIVPLLLAACGGGASNTASPGNEYGVSPASDAPAAPAAATAPPASAANSGLQRVTMALPFIPNVQFAAFYVAAEKGYYRDAGLDVAFDYNFETDVVQRTAQGTVEFAMAGATSVLLARQQGLPVKTVGTIYQSFPVVFFSKASNNVTTVADLKGKTVGIPGRFGDSYYALLATLYANDMQESDLTVQEIGFTQAEAVLQDKVQVATGYAMNEPVLLREQGQQINAIRVADSFPLASNGIIASEQLISENPDLVRRFVQASLRGLADTLADPDEAFQLSLKQIPEARLGDPKLQRTVLQESLPYWQNDKTTANGLGYTDVESWTKTEQFMRETKQQTGEPLLRQAVDVNTAFTNEFIK